MAGQVPTGLGLTLRLLPAPTAKVVAAGLGLDLLASHYRPSLCFSSAVPYDEDVFKVRSLPGMVIWAPRFEMHGEIRR